MKKVMMGVLAIVFMFVFVANVNAMTETELKNHVSAVKTVNGKDYSITQSAINQINQFLTNNKLSSSECDTLAAKFDEAFNIVKDSGAKSYKAYIKDNLNRAVSFANETANAVKSIKSITVSNDGSVVIVDANDKSYTAVDPVSEVGKGGAPIRNTGNLEVLYVALGISVLGVLVFANKVRKANN